MASKKTTAELEITSKDNTEAGLNRAKKTIRSFGRDVNRMGSGMKFLGGLGGVGEMFGAAGFGKLGNLAALATGGWTAAIMAVTAFGFAQVMMYKNASKEQSKLNKEVKEMVSTYNVGDSAIKDMVNRMKEFGMSTKDALKQTEELFKKFQALMNTARKGGAKTEQFQILKMMGISDENIFGNQILSRKMMAKIRNTLAGKTSAESNEILNQAGITDPNTKKSILQLRSEKDENIYQDRIKVAAEPFFLALRRELGARVVMASEQEAMMKIAMARAKIIVDKQIEGEDEIADLADQKLAAEAENIRQTIQSRATEAADWKKAQEDYAKDLDAQSKRQTDIDAKIAENDRREETALLSPEKKLGTLYQEEMNLEKKFRADLAGSTLEERGKALLKISEVKKEIDATEKAVNAKEERARKQIIAAQGAGLQSLLDSRSSDSNIKTGNFAGTNIGALTLIGQDTVTLLQLIEQHTRRKIVEAGEDFPPP